MWIFLGSRSKVLNLEQIFLSVSTVPTPENRTMCRDFWLARGREYGGQRTTGIQHTAGQEDDKYSGFLDSLLP